MPDRIPVVDYLSIDDVPHLVAHECRSCGARYFGRRNACASCFGTEFGAADIDTEGHLRAFTIVTFAAPGVSVPFVAGVVDCAGTTVRGNVVNTPADPAAISVGMKVRLTTFAVGVDDYGTEAIGFGFEPAEAN